MALGGAPLPSGTVTFLFTDIEGSTERWERDRAAMQDAVRRHDALVRSAIARHGGHVFKTIGDAFCAVFSRPEDGVAAALDAQRALGAEDFSAIDGLRARMSLHTGTADERDGDYFGPAVNRVARLLAIGHGGQVLVSGTVAGVLQGDMPPQSSLRDLGQHRLKDLARPEQVYQLVTPDLPETFPALRSLGALPNNLPRQLTSFVGREEVLAEIAALVGMAPLVTLVGTGGVGKTRAAVQTGADLLDGSGDGVWLVDLAQIADPSLVATVVARALGVQESASRPLLETLVAYLKNKHLLLILDNCEHVVAEARTAAAAILRGCPGVRILATSREALNIAGEQVYRMPSLDLPPAEDVTTAQDAATYGAVALFMDRARAVDVRFELSDENAPFVAEICRRLDGIPLAIELAAARVRLLAPRQLAQKLDERFRILTGGDRTALPRQQTMRALIDWSYDLLSDEERTLFRRLSIFAGGFTLKSASAVCRDDAIDELAALDLLSSLVDKSLVQVELAGEATRYRLLESTRQYAHEKLADRAEHAAIVRAHAAAYLELAEHLERTWGTTPDRAWLAQAEPELENWRAALVWALGAGGDIDLGQRLAGALRLTWSSLAAAEGRRWVRVALETVTEATPSDVIAKLDLTEADLAAALSQHKASHTAADRALERYRTLDDALGTAEAQRATGVALVSLGRIPEAEVLLQAACVTARALGAGRLSGLVIAYLAYARHLDGDFAGARALFAEALALYKATAAERLEATVSANLAELEFQGGDASAALRLAGEALATQRLQKNERALALSLNNVAAYLLALGRYDEARAHAREALVAAADTRDAVAVAFALQHLAAVAVLRPSEDSALARDERIRAARLLGYVDARIGALEALRQYTEQQEYDDAIIVLRDTLGSDDLAKLLREGREWRGEQAVAEASAGRNSGPPGGEPDPSSGDGDASASPPRRRFRPSPGRSPG